MSLGQCMSRGLMDSRRCQCEGALGEEEERVETHSHIPAPEVELHAHSQCPAREWPCRVRWPAGSSSHAKGANLGSDARWRYMHTHTHTVTGWCTTEKVVPTHTYCNIMSLSNRSPATEPLCCVNNKLLWWKKQDDCYHAVIMRSGWILGQRQKFWFQLVRNDYYYAQFILNSLYII